MKANPLPEDALNPENYAGFLIWQLSNKWEKYVNQKLKEFNTNQGECFHLIALLQLSTRLSEVTQVDISEVTGGSIMNTSKILRSLEQKQWITRQTASDSRAKSVAVTEAGLQVAIATTEGLAAANQDFYDQHHTPAFIATLQKLNQKHKQPI
jgi:DNA-binding MarR family transcriptional regulator